MNGLGNLIVGYDIDAGRATGSHNIIVGDQQTFTFYGGIMAGSRNELSAPRSVVFGFGNTAGGEWSSVTAGDFNTAAGIGSSITGGAYGTATGVVSSITGGYRNAVGGEWVPSAAGLQMLSAENTPRLAVARTTARRARSPGSAEVRKTMPSVIGQQSSGART